MSAQPNPACVRAVAFYLGAMNRTEAGDGMRMTLNAIRNGLIERGWQPDEAAEFACRFGDAVVDCIRSTPTGNC